MEKGGDSQANPAGYPELNVVIIRFIHITNKLLLLPEFYDSEKEEGTVEMGLVSLSSLSRMIVSVPGTPYTPLSF